MSTRALVVIDVQQEYFAAQGQFPISYPPVEDSLANIGAAMDAATAAGIPVVVVRHTSPAGAPAFDKGTPQWELHPVVATRPQDHVVEKHQPSAFFDTDLADWLSAAGIDTIAIAGYMTQNCDISTAFDGFSHGLAVEFLSDATGALPIANAQGTVSAQQVHDTLLVILASNIASVVDTAQWVEAVKADQALPRPNIIASTAIARGLR